MSTKKKAPSKAQLDARAKFTKMVKNKAAAKKKAGMKAPAKRTTAKKLCSSVIKREGVKADGTLKKGYKYAKGGRVVKAKPIKKVASKGKTSSVFYNGNDKVTVNSSKFRTIRGWSSTGIPKDSIKGGKEIYVSKSVLQKIKDI